MSKHRQRSMLQKEIVLALDEACLPNRQGQINTVAELARIVERDASSVRGSLSTLEGEGMVTRGKYGLGWRLTKEGRRAVKVIVIEICEDVERALKRIERYREMVILEIEKEE